MCGEFDPVRASRAFDVVRPLPLEGVFNYNKPQIDTTYFPSRRMPEFRRALKQSGTQAVVYGASGVGKTSIVITSLVRQNREYVQIYGNRDASVPEFKARLMQAICSTNVTGLSTTTENHTVSGFDAKALFVGGSRTNTQKLLREETTGRWWDEPTLEDLVGGLVGSKKDVIVDDAERFENEAIYDFLSELVKALSSNARNARTIIIVVAAHRREDLPPAFRGQGSKIVMIRVGRMTPAQIQTIVRHGMIFTWLRLSNSVVERIVALASGFPAFAHFLCLECGRHLAAIAQCDDQILTGREPCVGLSEFEKVIIPSIRGRSLANTYHEDDPRRDVIRRW